MPPKFVFGFGFFAYKSGYRAILTFRAQQGDTCNSGSGRFKRPSPPHPSRNGGRKAVNGRRKNARDKLDALPMRFLRPLSVSLVGAFCRMSISGTPPYAGGADLQAWIFSASRNCIGHYAS